MDKLIDNINPAGNINPWPANYSAFPPMGKEGSPYINKMASAIYNDIMGGKAGLETNNNLSIAELEDDIVDERLQVILEYQSKNILPRNSLLTTLSCIPVDLKSLDKSPDNSTLTRPQLHFEVPQILFDNEIDSVEYLGSTDRECQFVVYHNTAYQFHKYRKRGARRPFVYIEPTPNEHNLYDGWAYLCPMQSLLMITAIFKDPRQMMMFNNNLPDDFDNFSSISNEVKKRVTEKKLRTYRQFGAVPTPNNQAEK